MSDTRTGISGGGGLPDTGPQDIHGVTVHDVPNLVASVMRICEELDIDSQEDGWADEIIARGAVPDTGQAPVPANECPECRGSGRVRPLTREEIAEQTAMTIDALSSGDTGQAREPVALVDLRARIAAAFADVDNFAGEPPSREQLDQAHIAACVALNIGQDQPSGDTVQARPAYEPDGSVYDEPPASTDALAVAISDPGSILPRDYSNGIETVPSWAARAVRALLGADIHAGEQS